ncbi:SDR family oxidoreductase [Dyadobacter sp. NIV53]|uniref:SDR family oxidoreductase n=1 Tax=Dyadobacter sp. NIV53 TaxID=2861765 RepID=UPI002107AEB7|nr:SDR family oxidoreductase [Dyadobacter sp. NIV53]
MTGATGQVGSKTINFLKGNNDIEIVAAVRNPDKARAFAKKDIATVLFDFDDSQTHATALKGIKSVFMVTGYTVDMLRQSKVFLDSAKKAGVKHIVHLGACGRDDTTVAHWAWHQLVEKYIESSGFSFTHLRPETFMQNMLSYGGKKVVTKGVFNQYVDGARKSWVDVEDVAQVAALSLLHPDLHGGKTYRMGYDAKSYDDIADMMTLLLKRPYQYQPQSPDVFLQSMKDAGADMAYMHCVYDHYKRYAAGTIPGADDTFDNFYQITGNQPVTWEMFIKKHKAEFEY